MARTRTEGEAPGVYQVAVRNAWPDEAVLPAAPASQSRRLGKSFELRDWTTGWERLHSKVQELIAGPSGLTVDQRQRLMETPAFRGQVRSAVVSLVNHAWFLKREAEANKTSTVLFDAYRKAAEQIKEVARNLVSRGFPLDESEGDPKVAETCLTIIRDRDVGAVFGIAADLVRSGGRLRPKTIITNADEGLRQAQAPDDLTKVSEFLRRALRSGQLDPSAPEVVKHLDYVLGAVGDPSLNGTQRARAGYQDNDLFDVATRLAGLVPLVHQVIASGVLFNDDSNALRINAFIRALCSVSLAMDVEFMIGSDRQFDRSDAQLERHRRALRISVGIDSYSAGRLQGNGPYVSDLPDLAMILFSGALGLASAVFETASTPKGEGECNYRVKGQTVNRLFNAAYWNEKPLSEYDRSRLDNLLSRVKEIPGVWNAIKPGSVARARMALRKVDIDATSIADYEIPGLIAKRERFSVRGACGSGAREVKVGESSPGDVSLPRGGAYRSFRELYLARNTRGKD